MAKKTIDEAKLFGYRFNTNLAVIRILFGIIWAIDAAFKFELAFYNGILQTIQSADAGEPHWLNGWFHFWYRIIGTAPHTFALLVAIIEVLIALSLIFGVARRLNYFLAAIFSLLVWTMAEGFGGPYVSGSTDLGAGIVYVIAFLLLFVTDISAQPRWSLDPWLERHISWWHYLARPAK